MAARNAVFIHSPEFEKYSYPPDCPFNISRAGKTREILNFMNLLSGDSRREIVPEPATRITLKKFHTASYLHLLKAASQGKWDLEALHMGIGTPDCPVFGDMYVYSALACGATLTAANLILAGSTDIAFNPSGGLHHAGPQRASGFCYLNDVALGCTVLAEAGKKVLYLDIDVHHGDGVQNAFYDRDDVMTISFHQSGKTLFPGTGFEDEIGTGQGRGYSVNVPLPVGTYDDAYIKAFEAIAIPLIAAYNPDVIVFELGADTLAHDPLAHLQLTNNVYAKIINYLLDTQKPILATGGGGYNVENTAKAWAFAWSVFAGADRQNGLRDRELAVTKQQHEIVIPAIETTINAVKAGIFSFHGL